MMKALISFLPFSVRPVVAITMSRSATRPLVMKCFIPLTCQWSSCASAFVSIPPVSLPAFGSVRPQPPIHSPLVRRGRYCCRCSSVPKRLIWPTERALCAAISIASEAQVFPSSFTASAEVT